MTGSILPAAQGRCRRPLVRRLAALGLAALAAGAVLPGPARAQESLFYLELQGVAAWSSAARAIQSFSMMPGEPMQKPAAGFDWVRRIAGRDRDLGAFALQVRLAYDQDRDRPAVQVYNAWLKWKVGFSDLWAGHNRPALGLSSYFDNHALLLPTLAMLGFGFERDWGLGFAKDLARGTVAASLTTGSGMSLTAGRTFLAAGRVSRGIAGRDPLSVGLSAAAGRILVPMHGGGEMGGLPTTGSPEPADFRVVGLDAAHLWRNIENRAEIMIGRKAGAPAVAAFWRFGAFFLDEGRLRLELQPVLRREQGRWNSVLAAGLSWQLTADLAVRGMAMRDSERRDTRFVVQLYWSKRL